MKPALRVAVLVSGPLVAAPAQAGGPPAGWEVTPKTERKPVPAIDRCGDDETCLLRQTLLDAPISAGAWSAYEVDFAALPVVRKLEAPKDEAALRDVPPIRAIDGRGRPFPWDDGADGETRALPPGKLGEIAWNSEWTSPFFEEPRYRGLGYGAVRFVGDDVPKPVRALEGAVRYLSIDRDGDGIVYDEVVGKLDGTTKVVATRWEHAKTAPLPEGIGCAFRDDGDARSVTILLPEVFLGMESSRVTQAGGFLASSRYSTAQAYTRYVMPASPTATATVSFAVTEKQRRRWLTPLPPDASRHVAVLITTSQTSVEKAPRVVVLTQPRKAEE